MTRFAFLLLSYKSCGRHGVTYWERINSVVLYKPRLKLCILYLSFYSNCEVFCVHIVIDSALLLTTVCEAFVVQNRALARIGTSYYKKDDLKNALTYYNKSLSEHRESDVIKKSQEVRNT